MSENQKEKKIYIHVYVAPDDLSLGAQDISSTYTIFVDPKDTRPVSALWYSMAPNISPQHQQHAMDTNPAATGPDGDQAKENESSMITLNRTRLHTPPPGCTPIPWDTPVHRAVRFRSDLYLRIKKNHVSSSSSSSTSTTQQSIDPRIVVGDQHHNDRSDAVQHTVEVVVKAHQAEDQRQYRTALNLYQTLLPSLKGWIGIARVLLSMQRVEPAEEAVQCVLSADPDNAEMLSIKADLLMKKRNYAAALRVLQHIPEHTNITVRTADPTNGRAHTVPLRVYTLRRMGDCLTYLHSSSSSSSLSSSSTTSTNDSNTDTNPSSLFHVLSPPPIPIPPPPAPESQPLYHKSAQSGDPVAEMSLGLQTMLIDRPQQTNAAVATMLHAATTLHQNQHLRPALGQRIAAAFIAGDDAVVRCAADMILPHSMLDNYYYQQHQQQQYSSSSSSSSSASSSSSSSSSSNISGAASALSWIALLIRDYGALSAAVMLMERATDAVLRVSSFIDTNINTDNTDAQNDEKHDLRKQAAGYGLQLMHLLETAGQRYGDALRIAGRCLRLREDVRGLYEAGSIMMDAAERIEGRKWDDVCVDAAGLEDIDNVAARNGVDADESNLDNNNNIDNNNNLNNNNNDMDVSVMLDTMHQRGDGKYNAEELDVIGLLFTAVKIMYVCGVLQPLRRLVPMIERLRHAAQPLHHTSIRNEQAYYTSAIMLSAELARRVSREARITAASSEHHSISSSSSSFSSSSFSSSSSSCRRVYVIGDSHTLSPAWRTFRLPSVVISGTADDAQEDNKNKDRSEMFHAVPLVVTGVKCWHLRPESMFYPKFNFENAILRLPRCGQDSKLAVMLILGEIDCREGMVRAVEHGRYDSIEEAADGTVDIYRRHVVDRVLSYLGSSLDVLYIHPAPPVLDPTRHLTRAFNACLRKTFTGYNDPRVVLLDIEQQLLNEDGSGLRQEYHLDGTHLHPSYLDRFL